MDDKLFHVIKPEAMLSPRRGLFIERLYSTTYGVHLVLGWRCADRVETTFCGTGLVTPMRFLRLSWQRGRGFRAVCGTEFV